MKILDEYLETLNEGVSNRAAALGRELAHDLPKDLAVVGGVAATWVLWLTINHFYKMSIPKCRKIVCKNAEGHKKRLCVSQCKIDELRKLIQKNENALQKSFTKSRPTYRKRALRTIKSAKRLLEKERKNLIKLQNKG